MKQLLRRRGKSSTPGVTIQAVGGDQENDVNDDDDDDDIVPLVPLELKRGDEGRLEVEDDDNPLPSGTIVPCMILHSRYLGYMVLFLLLVHYMLLAMECRVAVDRKLDHSSHTQPWMDHYQVSEMATRKMVLKYPTTKKGGTMAYLPAGAILESIGGPPTQSGYLHMIQPLNGFVNIKSATSGKTIVTKVSPDPNPPKTSNLCPLVYAGWYPPNKPIHTTHFAYAPTGLVIGQQLWNAATVIFLTLLFVCWNDNKRRNNNNDNNDTKGLIQFVLLRLIGIATILLLPFSVYSVSPGAHVSVILYTLVCGIGIVYPSNLTITLRLVPSRLFGTEQATQVRRRQQRRRRPIFLAREEFIGLLAITCASMYNYRSYRELVPSWYNMFAYMDKVFDLKNTFTSGGSDTHIDYFYNLVFDHARTPLFVPRANTLVSGSTAFLFIWSILPYLYSTYLGLLWMLAVKSPCTTIQRLFIGFAMFHFLFWTDIVDYKYGRGYSTPHAELAHWAERFSWRIGLCMPFYQLLTSGHWKDGHPCSKWLGCLFHYGVMLWAVPYTVIEATSLPLRFYHYANGKNSKYGIIYYLFGKGHVLPKVYTSYYAAMPLVMLIYTISLVGGFDNYGIFLESQTMTTTGGASDQRDNYCSNDEELYAEAFSSILNNHNSDEEEPSEEGETVPLVGRR